MNVITKCPRFITFDGGEGSGKSTQIRKLYEWLSEALTSTEIISTREPGGTELGDQIRSLLIDPKYKNFSPKAEALLYAASRAQHVHEVIQPALNAKKWVISDRYVDASIAYQGVGRQLGSLKIENLNIWATDETLPDLCILLDIDPIKGLKRAQNRQEGHLDRLEQEKIEFHQKIRHYYLKLANRQPHRYLVIDAEKSEEEISELIKSKVKAWI